MALSQVLLSREVGPVWPMVHPGISSMGCLGKRVREGCGGGAKGALGGLGKWKGMLIRP